MDGWAEMNYPKYWFAAVLCVAMVGVGAVQAKAPPVVDPAACAAMAGWRFPATQIGSAVWQSAGPAKIPTATGIVVSYDLPAHCVVQGITSPYRDKAGRAYGVKFELRLPAAWNGRFLFQGGGGLDGVVRPAYGDANGAKPGLARGFAVVSMDGGHEGLDASFAANQQARLDFAYRAIGKATAVAKAAIAHFYDKAPSFSYFEGCSNGGREAMMAADRYPLEFDGIVAGDPGFRLAHAAVAEAWNNQHLAAIAPKGADGAPDLAAALGDGDLTLIKNQLLDQCDGLDGLRDGVINNQAACHFSPASLQCKPGQTANCLSAAKIAAIQAVFGGAHDSKGNALYSGFPYDGGIAEMGWRLWMLGIPHQMKSLNVILGGPSLSLYFMTPQQPDRSVYTLDFDHAEAEIAQTAAINDADSTMLNSFSGHGGKLLIYQGTSDPVFSALDVQAWYRHLVATDSDADSYARLFMVPGMNHCGGGVATDQFDPLSAVQAWVEQHRAPDRIVATGAALPGQSRPLCAYPRYAQFQGGDQRQAASFACVAADATKH